MPNALWYVAGLLTLPTLVVLGVLLDYAGFNLPSVKQGTQYHIVNFGVGQCVVADEKLAANLRICGYRIHQTGGTFWALKILRWSI